MVEEVIAGGEGVRAVLAKVLKTDGTEQRGSAECTPRQQRLRNGKPEFCADRRQVCRQRRRHDGGRVTFRGRPAGPVHAPSRIAISA
jgi:hypothetical protein